MLALATLAAACALAVTLAALFGMGRRRGVGDEAEYLAGAAQDDPYAPRPFLRMPLLTWLAARCGESGESRLRLLLAVVSVLTVATTAAAGWYLGGAPTAAAASLILALQPERTLLACHVWPDGLLALVLVTVHLLLVLPMASGAWLTFALGTVCALGILTRIDFLVVPPAVWASLLVSGRAVAAPGLVLLFGPTLLVLALWAARNYRRYGIPLPDNTWTFNLMVAESETERAADAAFALDPLVSETLSRWNDVPARERGGRALQGLAAALGRPGRFLHGVGRRFLTLCGPDTFLRQKLLPTDGAYPELRDRVRRRLDLPLRLAFPLLVTLAVLGAALRREAPAPYVWPAFSLMAVAVLFFARTRHRVALLPAFSLLAAEGLVALPEASFTGPDAALFVGAPLLLWALLRIRCARELPS